MDVPTFASMVAGLALSFAKVMVNTKRLIADALSVHTAFLRILLALVVPNTTTEAIQGGVSPQEKPQRRLVVIL